MKIQIFGKILQRIIHFEWISLFEICKLHICKKHLCKSYFFLFHMSNSCVLFCDPCDSNVLGKLELNVIDIHASFYRRKSKLQPHCQFLLEFGNAWHVHIKLWPGSPNFFGNISEFQVSKTKT